MDTPIKSLSGGNQQKVILARWLLTHPKYLILDEPTRGIDIGTKVDIQKLVLKLAEEGMTMVVVTHEMGFAREVGTKVVFMDEGRIIEENSPEEFFGNPQSPRLRDFLSKVL